MYLWESFGGGFVEGPLSFLGRGSLGGDPSRLSLLFRISVAWISVDRVVMLAVSNSPVTDGMGAHFDDLDCFHLKS